MSGILQILRFKKNEKFRKGGVIYGHLKNALGVEKIGEKIRDKIAKASNKKELTKYVRQVEYLNALSDTPNIRNNKNINSIREAIDNQIVKTVDYANKIAKEKGIDEDYHTELEKKDNKMKKGGKVNSNARIFGAFKDKSAAENRAKEKGAQVKQISVNGKVRYSVFKK